MHPRQDYVNFMGAKPSKSRGLTQAAASVHTGVSAALISEMLNKGHIPRIEILLRVGSKLTRNLCQTQASSNC
jgi:transcriptional regulator with XRE-family HTH domain